MTINYRPNKIWVFALRVAAFTCFTFGLFTILESAFETILIEQKCIGKEKIYNERIDEYSFKVIFERGFQYVDPEVYDLISIQDPVLFKCTPFHYTIVEVIFEGNISISNVRTYYAILGLGVFFMIMGIILLFFKFKKREHLVIWTFLIGFVLILVLIDLSNLIDGNPYGDNSIVTLKN